MSSSSRTVCPGCGLQFTVRGLTSHLKQTKNPPCKALFEEQHSYIPAPSPSPEPPPSSKQPPEPSHFGGDFFGDDYGLDDFQWNERDDEPLEFDINDLHLDDVDESGDPFHIDESDLESDLEDVPDLGWEPPIPPHPVPDNCPMEDDGHGRPAPSASQRSTAHDALRNPQHVQHFNDVYPDYEAGARVGEKSDTNTGYQHTLRDSASVWAPFASKIDWEVARWAKLRGPGSTAFSELLSIEGVRHFTSSHFPANLSL
jgi:hypothetical protein